MPKVSEMIVSRYLRKEDLSDGEDLLVTLKSVSLEDMPGDAGEQRWVLFFEELDKGLVLNTTTIRVLEKAFGSHSDDWMGQKTTLYVDPNVSFRGQVVGGLRLRPMKLAKRTSPAKAAKRSVLVPPADDGKFDDKIPM
jgi:hypothetical protein